MFVFSLVLATGVTFALRTPDLCVKDISIRGVDLCNERDVRARAQSVVGENILLARKSPVLRRISALSEVAEVRMGRTLPDGMWVEVRERKPFAVIAYGDRHFMIQSDGLVFHRTCGPVTGVPLMEVAACEQPRLGVRMGSPDVAHALQALRHARRERLKVGKISIDHAGDMCLNMESDFCVRLGQPDEIAEKMKLLRSALDYRPSLAREARYIDLSCPRAPVWKPKSGAQAAS
jgi:hypothetical protein